MLTESFIWRDGQVRWSRQGSGPPLVFCHGTPWSSALWKPIADTFSDEFTVHLWDMLGYGASTMGDGQDVSLAAQGALLADMLEHWDLAEPHVVAHDYGGAVALRAHLLHGARYRSLALVETWSPWHRGVEDTWIPVDRAHRLAEQIPGAELRLVPQAGHLIQLDAPERLTAILHRWLYRPAAVPEPGGQVQVG